MTKRENQSFISHSANETIRAGDSLARLLKPGEVIALVGELGAGKTQFVRGLARGLGHSESAVSSPTYVLIHEYAADPKAIPLIHIDAYRLSGIVDESTLGLDHEHLDQVITAVEWPDRMGSAMPNPTVIVELAHRGPEERSISVKWT